jgi:hypothetical protein
MVGEHVRVIQTAGDGILAEFGSIFDTVECAPIMRASNFCGPLFRSRFVRK